MIIYIGKAKDTTREKIISLAFLKLSRPIEKLESVDFSVN